MKTMSFLTLGVLATVAAAPAYAERAPRRPVGNTAIKYVPLPAEDLKPLAEGKPRALKRTIFLNRQGGGYSAGPNDSATNTSSLVIGGPYNIAPASYNDGEWAELMACVREMYAPFAVEIVDIEPTEGHWIEVVFPKDSSDIGHPPNEWGGVAFDVPCANQIVGNGIVYSVDYWPPIAACSVVAQESGHMFGLEHSADCTDPMSYGYVKPTCMPHAFRDVDAACVGTDGSPDAACRCHGSTQNTYQILIDRIGPNESESPVVMFTAPADGATVKVGSEVTATASDNIGVTKVELLVDDVSHATDTAGPTYRLPLARSLAPGLHTLRLRAYDNAGNLGEAGPISVTVEAECATDDECPDGASCNGVACVGGIGAVCSTDDACASGLCADVGEPDKVCTLICSGPSAAECPSGTTCQSAGAGLDKCLPAGGGGGPCGCRAGGAGPWPLGAAGGALTFAFIFSAGLLARRRRGKEPRFPN